MEPQLTPGAAASRAINAIRQQMQNALATLENQDTFLRESIEQAESVSVAEYNEAIERLEAQYVFTDQQKQEILEANAVITLHDIMMHQAFKLSKIKGISDKSAQSIMECANKYVADNYHDEEREAA